MDEETDDARDELRPDEGWLVGGTPDDGCDALDGFEPPDDRDEDAPDDGRDELPPDVTALLREEDGRLLTDAKGGRDPCEDDAGQARPHAAMFAR